MSSKDLLMNPHTEYTKQSLCIFVIGASGDLAKKKTYPSLFELYIHNFLPTHTIICGYARSNKTNEEFRSSISSYLKTTDERKKNQFLNMCIYRHGGYDSINDVGKVSKELQDLEKSTGLSIHNRLFYFAIPPNVFVPAGTAIKGAALTCTGWNRLIVEKPFGHDLTSCNELCQAMGALYTEDEIYRIDHYLGKEMVQNLLLLRFTNATLEPLWNHRHISSITITFKEDIGTMGRGGYFDSYGIIRDVMQNHLLQVLSLIAMEPPVRCVGENHANFVRDEKVKVLRCIEPVKLEDAVLGQYVGNDKELGYLDDKTVPAGSTSPTFCSLVMRVNNSRWDGVPFIMKAGKALDERKAEVRIQFREPPGASQMFPNTIIPRNELVLRLQPQEAVYLKTNVKSPGLRTIPMASELDLSYASRYEGTHMPDAYTRLLLDVLRGNQSMFVRDDELRTAWSIFTPLLHEIESKKIKPLPYAFGTRGPKESDELSAKYGFVYHQGDYQWQPATSIYMLRLIKFGHRHGAKLSGRSVIFPMKSKVYQQYRMNHTSMPPVYCSYDADPDSDDDYDEDIGPSIDNQHGFAEDFIPLFRNETGLPKKEKKFRLSKKFVQSFKNIPPPFGFNGLGELVYMRTYSRDKPDGTKEKWHETVERVVNGTYNMQKHWLEHRGLGWNGHEAHRSAREMYRRIFEMKFLPPGRGLWAMGSPITEERKLYAALNNCAFVSTEDVDKRFSPAEPFCFLMDAAMLGVGVGFDTKGAGKIMVKGPKAGPVEVFEILDSREGWVESLRIVLESYFLHRPLPVFDYSKIRAAGMPIKGFGGISSGPESLKSLHGHLKATLDPLIGAPMTVRGIVDLMNHIGVCVVSGNVRRTAEIAFGDANDPNYVALKDYNQFPDRASYGWTSNNSVFATLGMDYSPICKQVANNGEPGFAWLQNMQEYSRMDGVPDHRDARAAGGNPCLEQTLESYELCCLVETFPANHASLEEYKETLRYAYLYAKTVTLGQTHWPITNRVMLRNRRIGCSMSGIAQFITKQGLHELKTWCTAGYDAIQSYDKMYSDFLAIPRSIKTTSIKPSGTVSLLAGATPGMHYPESRFYIRRVRLDKGSELLPALIEAGYHIEPACEAPNETLVVSIPVDVGENVRTLSELSAWEQLSLAAFLQRYWADNQVSCTITFDPKTEGSQLEHALAYFQYQLKGVSLLPKVPMGAYAQMPYEEITSEQYKAMISPLKPLVFQDIQARGGVVDVPDRFCDSSSCEIK